MGGDSWERRRSLYLCLSQLTEQLTHRVNSLESASTDHYTFTGSLYCHSRTVVGGVFRILGGGEQGGP